MSNIKVCPMKECETSAFKFIHGYLPDSDLREVSHYTDMYAEAANVITDGDVVAGAAFGHKYEGAEDRGFVLDGIAVEEIYRRSGYGSMLLEMIEKAAVRYGCKKEYDVNGDSRVNGSDIAEIIAAVEKSRYDKKCDINGDGKVNYADADAVRSVLRQSGASTAKIAHKKVNTYYTDAKHKKELDMYFMDGSNDIPYISVEDMAKEIKMLSCNDDFFEKSGFDGEKFVMKRNNGSYSVIDFAENAIYFTDLNLDGEYDDTDSFGDKNLFVLTSRSSFSCGNLVPCAMASDRRVTIVGQQSGGGSCAVQPLCTADGTTFQVSSRYHLATMKNGYYYDIDQGVAPDIYLNKPENSTTAKSLWRCSTADNG